ncbi:MAG: glycoside hydrolase family 28 protein [Opitutales bacterium]|nr:glycoside hydrolase family 28 protein [Opitutales bacterium]
MKSLFKSHTKLIIAILLPTLAFGTNEVTRQIEEIVQVIHQNQTSFPDKDFNVIDFGAVGDGKHDDLPAIQEAIDTCSLSGGGRVVLPDGIYYLRGPIHFKSNVNLHLKNGSEIRFSAIPEDFLPPVLTRWECTELFNYSPFIYAYQCSNIAITGSGLINGNVGETFAKWRPNQKPDQLALREMGDREIPLHNRVFGGGHWLRPSFIQTFGCNRVLIEGVKIIDSPFWIVHPVYSNYIIVRGVHIESMRLNNDGVDPDSCSYVLIEDCTFRTGDDAVAIKSGRDTEGRNIGVPSENIVIRNNRLLDVHNGLAIGSEMSGSVRNVFMENNTVEKGRNLLYFKSNLDRGGIIENVHVRNIEVEQAEIALIRFQTNYHSYRGGNFPPIFRHFRINNVSCGKAEHGIWAEGHEEAPLQDIMIQNTIIKNAKTPLKIGPNDEVSLQNVTINGKTFES